MPKLRPLAWSDVRNGVLDGTSDVRGGERAATNDASTGVQVQLPPRSRPAASLRIGTKENDRRYVTDKYRRAARGVSLKLRQCLAGITTKRPSVRSFAARFWGRNAIAYQPVLSLSEPVNSQRGRQWVASLTALPRSEAKALLSTIRPVRR